VKRYHVFGTLVTDIDLKEIDGAPTVYLASDVEGRDKRFRAEAREMMLSILADDDSWCVIKFVESADTLLPIERERIANRILAAIFGEEETHGT
jgi:hypothetical protein